MFPHSEANPARLAVAATHGVDVVAAEVVAVVADDGNVEGVESHKLMPQFVVVGPAGFVTLTEERGLFCPQPATPRARAATTRTALAPNRIHSNLPEVPE
jgi:hypothetical protein